MQLSKHSDYAFRVLIHLSALPDGALIQIKDIAERFQISRSHLMKVVQKLAQRGFVEAKRGKGGGLRLAKPAQSIGCREIIETMEPTLTPVNCDQPPCLIRGHCKLAVFLNQAQEAFLNQMAHYTLADLSSPETHQILLHPTNNTDSKANSLRAAQNGE